MAGRLHGRTMVRGRLGSADLAWWRVQDIVLPYVSSISMFAVQAKKKNGMEKPGREYITHQCLQKKPPLFNTVASFQ